MTYTCTVCGTEHWTEDGALKCAEEDRAIWHKHLSEKTTNIYLSGLELFRQGLDMDQYYLHYGPARQKTFSLRRKRHH